LVERRRLFHVAHVEFDDQLLARFNVFWARCLGRLCRIRIVGDRRLRAGDRCKGDETDSRNHESPRGPMRIATVDHAELSCCRVRILIVQRGSDGRRSSKVLLEAHKSRPRSWSAISKAAYCVPPPMPLRFASTVGLSAESFRRLTPPGFLSETAGG